MPLSPDLSHTPAPTDRLPPATDDRLTATPPRAAGAQPVELAVIASAGAAPAGASRLHNFLLVTVGCFVGAMLVLGVVLFLDRNAEPHPAPAPKASPTATRVTSDPALWKALGGLTRANLYQSHLSIGLLADNVEEDLYSLPEARKLLVNSIQVLRDVEHDLDGLPEADLSAEDRQLLDQVREALVLLRTQARELRTYWASGEKAAADRFHEARSATGVKLGELVRLDP